MDEGRDLTPEELRSVEAMAAEGQAMYGEIETLAAEEERHAQVDALAGQLHGDGPASHITAALRPYALVPTAAQVAELRTAVGRRRQSMRVALGRVAVPGRPLGAVIVEVDVPPLLSALPWEHWVVAAGSGATGTSGRPWATCGRRRPWT